MTQIRSFRNRDLPALADVWSRHWSAVGPPPQVSVSTIEQAILSRTFFSSECLLVAEVDNAVVAWCHYQPAAASESTAVLCAICFTPDEGLAICDQLLGEAESRIAQAGYQHVMVGTVRDDTFGYAGLSPLGYGIGVPARDARTSSLLSRHRYQSLGAVSRLVISTSPYRLPVSREALQLRRTTRVEKKMVVLNEIEKASALSHVDIERLVLIDHRTSDPLAQIDWWLSDSEAQVMSCAESILDLGEIHDRGELQAAESFLIAATIQTLSNRRVYTVETAVHQTQAKLISQLQSLQFQVVEQGQRWTKSL